MRGKIAQLLTSRRPASLEAITLDRVIAPIPMAVPEEQRKEMIEAYGTRQGVEATLRPKRFD